MVITVDDVQVALAQIAVENGDSLAIEAKRASAFSRKSLGPTFSAFANLPGGGTILLGVDENADELIVGIDKPHQLAQEVTNFARNGLSVPLSVETSVVTLDGRSVLAVNVKEAPITAKPVEFDGQAYVRQYDGDYTMSPQEQQQFLLRHTRPRADREPVPGTSIADLDPRLVDEFVRSVRHMTPTLVDVESDEILRRLNVLRDSGEATVGGLYALGIYPQQFLPHLSLTAAVIHEDSDDTEDDRATNRRDFTGPIATILDAAVDWVAQNVTSTMTVNDNGYGSTRYAVPLKAVREVVANALVHRDLTDATSGRVVELRLTPRGLVLTSPGGLWGLTVEQLGTPDGKSAVNEFLYTICRHISGHTGRVIEAMGTGIRTTQKALAAASLEPPRFYDNGLRFTVMFPSHSLYNEQELAWLATLGPARLSAHHKNALLALRTRGSLTNADYRKITGVDPVAARKELRQLEQLGLITRVGERRGTRYELAQGHRND